MGGEFDWPRLAFRKLVMPAAETRFGNGSVRVGAEDFPATGGAAATRSVVCEAVIPSAMDLAVSHAARPRSLWDHLGSRQDAVIMNLGFCFVADRTPRLPPNCTYQFQVSDGRLWSLPTKSRTALLLTDEGLLAETVEARGWLEFGAKRVTWAGSHETDKEGADAEVFGLPNQALVRTRRGIVARRALGRVVAGPGQGNVGLALVDGVLTVARVTRRPLSVMDYVAVMRGSEETWRGLAVGERLTKWQVGRWPDGKLRQAVTVGPRLWPDAARTQQQLADERIVMSRRPDGRPYFTSLDTPKARAALFEDGAGALHLVVVDARPGVVGQEGVTLTQLAAWVFRREGVRWAVTVDGGQSAKLGLVSGGRRRIFGNLHYLNLAKEGAFWDGWRGRPVTTCLLAPIRSV